MQGRAGCAQTRGRRLPRPARPVPGKRGLRQARPRPRPFPQPRARAAAYLARVWQGRSVEGTRRRVRSSPRFKNTSRPAQQRGRGAGGPGGAQQCASAPPALSAARAGAGGRRGAPAGAESAARPRGGAQGGLSPDLAPSRLCRARPAPLRAPFAPSRDSAENRGFPSRAPAPRPRCEALRERNSLCSAGTRPPGMSRVGTHRSGLSCRRSHLPNSCNSPRPARALPSAHLRGHPGALLAAPRSQNFPAAPHLESKRGRPSRRCAKNATGCKRFYFVYFCSSFPSLSQFSPGTPAALVNPRGGRTAEIFSEPFATANTS